MKAPLFFALFISGSLAAQSVSLDPNFGTDGIIVTPSTTEIHKTAFTSDGKIISAGYSITPNSGGAYHLTLTKHHADGTIDDDFGINGTIEHQLDYSSQPFDIAIQNDGKIVLTGFIYEGPTQSGPGQMLGFAARCNADGTLDSSFATNGSFILNVQDSHFTNVFLEDDGSILLSGNIFNGAVFYKLNSDGTTDTNYGTNGMVQFSTSNSRFINWSAIKLQDGNILSVGLDATETENTKLACQKTDFDGNLITTFGENGQFIYDGYTQMFPEVVELISEVEERTDGKIVLSGNIDQRMIAVLNTDGTLYTDFGTNGFVLHNYANSDLLVQEDNKILLGGNKEMWDYNYGISITRLTSDGELDPTFNYFGEYELDISEENDYLQTFTFMDDTHILVGGSSRINNGEANFLLARLDISETLSLTEASQTSFSIYPNPAKSNLFIDGISPEKVSVMNNLGQVILETSYNNKNGLDIHKLAAGSYILSFENENKSYSEAFMKF